jgi:protein-S-isoprenylcysteine O-methyltransferase Ste14
MLARVIVQIGLFLALQGAVLFVAAGTVEWPGAWTFLGIMGAGSLAISVWLLKHAPALLAARLSPVVQRRQAAWDRVLMAGCLGLWFGCLALTALDAVCWRWSDVPVWAQVVGGAGMVATFYHVYLAFRENPYAAPVVTLQRERKQTVVSSGPYRYVRHPMYAGGIPFFAGAPLVLGSWYGLVLLPIMVPVLAVRCVLEERMLIAGLDGYSEYTKRVRYRLIPGMW